MTIRIALLLALVFTLNGCSDDMVDKIFNKQTTYTVTQTVTKYTITIGNHSFVPLKIEGLPSDNVTTILEALSIFESLHPNLEITNHVIEYQPKNGESPGRTYGIWINHRPKENFRVEDIG